MKTHERRFNMGSNLDKNTLQKDQPVMLNFCQINPKAPNIKGLLGPLFSDT